MWTNPRLKQAALALPVVVLAVMVVRAEVIIAAGRTYELLIEGYDPRDLLRGQYLRYRVKWNMVGSTGGGGDVCLVQGAETVNPAVRMGGYAPGSDQCQAVIRAGAVENLNQYFIPEDMGPPLERAIRDRRASLRVHVSGGGDVVIEDLLLDGRPWREVISD